MSATVLAASPPAASGKQRQQSPDAQTRRSAGLLSGLLLGHSAGNGREGGRAGMKHVRSNAPGEAPKECSHVHEAQQALPLLLDSAWMTGLRSLPATHRTNKYEQPAPDLPQHHQQKPHAGTAAPHQQQRRGETGTAASLPPQQAASSSDCPSHNSFSAEESSERSHGPSSSCLRALIQQGQQHQQGQQQQHLSSLQQAHVPHQSPFAHSTLPIPSAATTQSAPQQCQSAPQPAELSLAEERAVKGGKAALAAAGPVACEAARAGSSVGRNQGVAPVFFSPLPFSYLNVAKSISTDQLLQQEHSASPDVTLRAGRLTVGASLTHSDWPVDVELASSSPSAQRGPLQAEASDSHLAASTSRPQSQPQAYAGASNMDARRHSSINTQTSWRSGNSLSPGMPGTLLEAAEAASSLHSQQGMLADSPSSSCVRGPLHSKAESPSSSPSARETLLAEAAAAEAGAMPAPLVQALDRAPSTEEADVECESTRHAQQHSPAGLPPPTVAPAMSPAMRALQGAQRESLPTTPITAPLAEDESTRPSRTSSFSPSSSPLPALGTLHPAREQNTAIGSPSSTPTPSIPPTPTPAATHLPSAPPSRPAFPPSANIRFGKAPAPPHAHAASRAARSSSSSTISPRASATELPAFSAPNPEKGLRHLSPPHNFSAVTTPHGTHAASQRLSISSCAAPASSSTLPPSPPHQPPHAAQQQHHFNTPPTAAGTASSSSSHAQPSPKFSFTFVGSSSTSCSTPFSSAAHASAQQQPFATPTQHAIAQGGTPTHAHAAESTQSGPEAQGACMHEGGSTGATQAQSQQRTPPQQQSSARSVDGGSMRGGLSRQLSSSSSTHSAHEAMSGLTAALAQATHASAHERAGGVEGGSCDSSSSSMVEGSVGWHSKGGSPSQAESHSEGGTVVSGSSPSSAVGGPLLAGTDLSQGRGGPSAIARTVQRARKNPQLSSMRLMAGAVMIPHVDKADKGGEDAYCICQAGHGAIGVADGVSGWVEEGIDPAEYSRMLMKHCEDALTAAGAEAQGREVIRHAHLATVMPGSSTVCLALMKPEGRLEVVNLGDSGVRVIRDGVVTFASAAQQHMFNMPFQLSHPSIIESPDDADSCSVSVVDVQPGDVILLATDGLYDNMFDEEIARICGDYMKRRRRSSLRLVGGSDAPPTAAELAAAAVAQARQQQFTSAEAEFLAQEIARLAHNYANDPCRRTPWSVASCEQNFSWAHYFSDGGGKMDDCTVVVAFVQLEHPEAHNKLPGAASSLTQ